ncbi:MAG: hypothetical protein Q8O00_11755 [Holophaga sp.]|nr:hypothetical protein [Holophaga sp.]
MTQRYGWLLIGTLLISVGCAKDRPTPFRDKQLGIAVVFPGEPISVRYSEPTPYGTVEWHGRSFRPAIRMDQNFQVDVGNLPEGTRGGSTPSEVVETYDKWLRKRLGKVGREELSIEKGPGFKYHAVSPAGTHLLGQIVVRRGRLHRAEVEAPKQNDPRAKSFLDSFEVLP